MPRHEDLWLRSGEFQEFYNRNGRFPGVAGDKYELSLHSWGATRRNMYRSGKITEDELYEHTKNYPAAYEFIKNNTQKATWYKKYEEYKRWTRTHLRIPSATFTTDKEESALFNWMRFNIKQYKDGKLPQDRIDKINEISPLLLSETYNRNELNNLIRNDTLNKEFFLGYYVNRTNKLRIDDLIRSGISTFNDMYYAMIDRLESGEDKNKICKDLMLDDGYIFKAFVNFIFKHNATIYDIILYKSIFRLHILDVLSNKHPYNFNIHDRLMYIMYNYINSDKYTNARKRYFQIVVERYYDNNIHMTIELVAQRHNLKRQRIHQIIDEFFKYMRTPEISDILLTGRIKTYEPLSIKYTEYTEIANIDNYKFNNIDLSNRAFNCLARANIIYFRDLIKFFNDNNCSSQDDRHLALKSIRGLGESCADEIMDLFNKGINNTLILKKSDLVNDFQTYETKVNKENFGKEIEATEKAILSIVENDDIERIMKLNKDN